MIISPRGKIMSRAQGPDGLAIADIDPRGGRRGGDSSNTQQDMRARLFRERNAEAFGMLLDPQPPVLEKVPIDISQQEAGRIFARMLTLGEEEFRQATALARAMVARWGMSKEIGPVDLRESEEHPFLGREIAQPRRFSEASAEVVDRAVRDLLQEAEARALMVIRRCRGPLERLVAALEREETLDRAGIEACLGTP